VKRIAAALALLLALAGLAAAEPEPAALRRALGPLAAGPGLAHALVGVEVRSLKTGRVLYAQDAERAFRPGSTLKLVTTAAALDAYGPQARLRTSVETAARLDSLGRVLGDVFLVGGGDPSLSARFSPGRATAAFEQIADALVAAGVRRIEGRLVGHEGTFTGERRGADWSWEDLAWEYGAPASALVFNDDVVALRVSPGERVGDPAQLEMVPPTALMTVGSSVTTAAADASAQLRLEREPGSNEVRLSGTLPLGGGWSGELAVEDPARFAATAFAAVLEARGIRVSGGVLTSRAPLPTPRRVLAVHDGVAMAELIRAVNKDSLNLHAEMLLRLLGLRVGAEGSAEAGRQAVTAFLARLGVPSEGWQLRDGCGLSRGDLVTPHGLAALLVAMDRHPYAAVFRDSLPVGGRDGTLARRFRGTAAEGRVQAKTGSLDLANALAGYASTRDGERVAFAICVNNHARAAREALAAIDAMVEAMVSR
jgi:D-alanyl-D-alanine carboxypeptidase/D-alanyl-D-alanine-endopeptidase (penicillin-binding protein 4)